MRIVFFGASELGFDCCESIINNGFDVVGICTIPQSFSIKYKGAKEREEVKNYLFKDFSDFERKGIPVYTKQGSSSDYEQEIISLNPDLIIVIGWYYLIPESIINVAKKGTIGIHASLLPKYRGNAPLVWAMINGENKTGISLFYIERGIDEGDVIDQREIYIEREDTIKEVLEKAKVNSIKSLLELLPKIKDGSAPRIKQDHSKATIYPKRTPEDGLIDWSWDSDRIENFIKAQTKPYPGAFTIIDGKKVTIWSATINKIRSKQ